MPNKLYSNPCNRCLMSCGFLHQIVPQSTIETYLTRCCSTHLGMLGEGESDCWDTIDYERTPLHSTVLRDQQHTLPQFTSRLTAETADWIQSSVHSPTLPHHPPCSPVGFSWVPHLHLLSGGWLGPYSVYGWVINADNSLAICHTKPPTLTTKTQFVGLING